MQKEYFCPEENTKPSASNCATFYTKIFYRISINLSFHWL